MRIIIAAIVGGLIFFLWSAVAHVATPIGMMGFANLADDARVMDTIRSLPASGLYYLPSIDMSKKPTHEQMKAWDDKVRQGPSGFLVVNKGAGATMSAQTLLSELLTNIIAALIGAILVSFMIGSWLKRAAAVMLIGAFGIISLLLSYWIWYGFPAAFVAGEAITEIVGWLLAGLAIAKIVRPPFSAIVPATAVP